MKRYPTKEFRRSPKKVFLHYCRCLSTLPSNRRGRTRMLLYTDGEEEKRRRSHRWREKHESAWQRCNFRHFYVVPPRLEYSPAPIAACQIRAAQFFFGREMLRTSDCASITHVTLEVNQDGVRKRFIANTEKEFHFYFRLSCVLLRHYAYIEVQVSKLDILCEYCPSFF